MEKNRRILTGHRPTGPRHLGHLVGTLDTWRRLQDDHECLFLVADLHVLTTDYTHPQRIRANIEAMLLDWLGVGLDPEKSTFVLQSAVPEHAELAVLLSMLVTVARAARNPTYKEQVRELGLSPSLGLLAYPVLQAADILAYKADAVPVGQDQLPHLEITREIARSFNRLYGTTFPEPEPILSAVPRLPGTDGRTMHTSYGNTLPLAANPDEITTKVLAMVTDPARVHPTDPGHPEVCLAFAHHRTFRPAAVATVEDRCRRGGIGCVPCKGELALALVERLAPFRAVRETWRGREDELWDILRDGSRRARPLAQSTLAEVRDKMGLVGVMMGR
ncbi:MAG: tryptophan--tRNA ligase [Candidatus Bipolaricaulota bacterium]